MSADPRSAAPALAIKGLRVVFGETVAVEGIDFEVAEGSIFGFIGPNGAGKTTTIRVLATLLEPTAGSARVGGLDVLEEPEEVRRILGYMPDDFGVYDGITVWEYLDFFAGAFRIPRQRRRAILDGVLELTDLGRLRERMVASLSKGMRQRLCLARTLVHDPAVLVLDEPASAMDPRARIELRELLRELQSMGKTILISSHILTELSGFCDAVGIIEKGRMVVWGSVDSITERVLDRRAVRVTLERDAPGAAEALAEHPHVAGVESGDRELRFDYSGPPAEFHRVLKILVDRGVPVLTVSQETSDLERVFMEVTRGELH